MNVIRIPAVERSISIIDRLMKMYYNHALDGSEYGCATLTAGTRKRRTALIAIASGMMALNGKLTVGEIVTFHTHAKVVGIMRQNAKSFSFFPLAFCVQNLL